MFDKASGFVIRDSRISQTIHYHSGKETGLEKLLQVSVPEAAHDSYARSYPPRCFPGTREQHIEDFTLWVTHPIPGRFRMSWMHGPAGVGKSAIAQTCAEKLEDRLGAAFFFSGPNQGVDPDRFFPSIAYQISTKVEPFANILDEKIRRNPSILTKTIQVQFRELIVAPMLELEEKGVKVEDRLVIIDGLDECGDDRVQRVVIELIAAVVQDYGERLPLLWAFFTRPEPHIVRTFSSGTASPLTRVTVLPVSREIDGEIELYLRGEFENIRKRHHHLSSGASFNAPWPSDDDIAIILIMSCGLFIYAATVMKFIADPDVLDPREHLGVVLSLRSRSKKTSPVDKHPSPIADIDALYTLIMRRISAKVLPVTLCILLLWSQFMALPPLKPQAQIDRICHILGIDFHSFAVAVAKLHSVLAISDNKLKFYHASFLEFLADMNRSGPNFWIHQPQHYKLLAERGFDIMADWHKLDPTGSSSSTTDIKVRAHTSVSASILQWLACANLKDEEELVHKLVCFDFKKYLDFASPLLQVVLESRTLRILLETIPLKHRNQVITHYTPRHSSRSVLRESRPRPISQVKNKRSRSEPDVGYVLGQGEKSITMEFDTKGALLHYSSGPESTLREVDFYRHWKT